MRRILVLVAALVAVFVFAPSAQAAAITIRVNDNGDAPDATPGDGICDSDAGTVALECTLRAAIQTANETPDADTIQFIAGGQAPVVLTALPAVTQPVSIDGQGAATVTFDPAATGNLLDLEAANSLVRSIVFTGGGAGNVLTLGATGDRLDTVTVHDVAGTAIRMAGASGRVDGSRVSHAGGDGINLSGNSATISSPTVTGATGSGINVSGGSSSTITNVDLSGNSGNGITLNGSGANVSGGGSHDNGGSGAGIGGQQNSVTHVVFYANGSGKAIATAPGANGGIGPPTNLRIGPRRPDGSLPLTGNANTGTLELWSGNPNSGNPPSLLDAWRASGDFTYNLPSEPAPGSVFAVSQTGDGLGTGEFAIVTVPDDVTSPDITFSRALDTSNVRVDFSEPVDPASVQKEDFKLTMAGVERPISFVTVSPDGRYVVLTSSGWRAGEAGFIDVNGVGAINDSTGNAMLTAPHLRVAAAPGDFFAPLGGSLKLTPSNICLTRGKNCKKPGMTIKFTSTEAGKARMVIKRSDKTLGSRLYANIVAGKNTLKFNGRLGARKLRAGRYRLLMYVQDAVGNVTDQPPIQLFTVRRVTK